MEEMNNLPAEVNTMATFHVVRVSSMDEGVDQYAYQTSVKIGGHVFKGILYDQGLERSCHTTVDQISSTTSSLFQQPNFVNSSALISATGSATINAFAASQEQQQQPIVTSSTYPLFPSNAFVSGMQFFPNRKS